MDGDKVERILNGFAEIVDSERCTYAELKQVIKLADEHADMALNQAIDKIKAENALEVRKTVR